MAARAGIVHEQCEVGISPILRFLEACAGAISSESAKTPDALPSAYEERDSSTLRAQELSSLTKIIAAWPYRTTWDQPIVR